MTRTFYPGSRAFLAGIVALAAATTFAGGARATVIYDATGGRAPFEGADVADPNAPGGVGVGPLLADRFLSPFAERLTSVTLNLKLDGRPLDGFTVDLWRDFDDHPWSSYWSRDPDRLGQRLVAHVQPKIVHVYAA